jgi:hypothetical protein
VTPSHRICRRPWPMISNHKAAGRDRRHHEEVHRRDTVSMVAKERLPPLRGRSPPPRHIVGHAGLANVDAELEQLTKESRRSPQRVGDAHLADQPANFQGYCRSTVAAPRFQRQYNLKPARCQRITVSGRTIASASYVLGNSRQTPPNINLSIDPNGSLLGLARRSTWICCLSTKISASSVARDRGKSITASKISLHKSNIERQHRPIPDQAPADWIYDRNNRLPPACAS